jgi:hypothetical protein
MFTCESTGRTRAGLDTWKGEESLPLSGTEPRSLIFRPVQFYS